MEPDISILRKTGHFYFALTAPFFWACLSSIILSMLETTTVTVIEQSQKVGSAVRVFRSSFCTVEFFDSP
jgi:hypothetical protein